jgi:hypothetical protein
MVCGEEVVVVVVRAAAARAEARMSGRVESIIAVGSVAAAEGSIQGDVDVYRQVVACLERAV